MLKVCDGAVQHKTQDVLFVMVRGIKVHEHCLVNCKLLLSFEEFCLFDYFREIYLIEWNTVLISERSFRVQRHLFYH